MFFHSSRDELKLEQELGAIPENPDSKYRTHCHRGLLNFLLTLTHMRVHLHLSPQPHRPPCAETRADLPELTRRAGPLQELLTLLGKWKRDPWSQFASCFCRTSVRLRVPPRPWQVEPFAQQCVLPVADRMTASEWKRRTGDELEK